MFSDYCSLFHGGIDKLLGNEDEPTNFGVSSIWSVEYENVTIYSRDHIILLLLGYV